MANRRKVLVALVSSLTLAGCSSDPESGSGPTNENDDPTPTEESQETASNPTEESSGDTSEPNYQVKIIYDGEWSGSISGDGSSKSVDGSGTETFDVSGNPLIVSANAQKQDDSSDELVIQILKGGKVIAEESTSAEYGIAQVTSEDDDSGSGSDGSSGSTFEVKVEYNGEWQGSVSAGGSSRSIEGTGSKTIDIDGSPDIISANAQKEDDSSDELTIKILKDGKVVKEASTTAEYGVAQVTYSNY